MKDDVIVHEFGPNDMYEQTIEGLRWMKLFGSHFPEDMQMDLLRSLKEVSDAMVQNSKE